MEIETMETVPVRARMGRYKDDDILKLILKAKDTIGKKAWKINVDTFLKEFGNPSVKYKAWTVRKKINELCDTNGIKVKEIGGSDKTGIVGVRFG